MARKDTGSSLFIEGIIKKVRQLHSLSNQQVFSQSNRKSSSTENQQLLLLIPRVKGTLLFLNYLGNSSSIHSSSNSIDLAYKNKTTKYYQKLVRKRFVIISAAEKICTKS